jgi:hypothetical protein
MFLWQIYEKQWKARLIEGRQAVTCTHYFCDAIGFNKLNKVLGNAYAHMLHGDERISLWIFKWLPRVGASGAIYGVLGAQIYTAFWSPWHHAPNRVFYASVAFMVVQDVKDAPALSLKGLSQHLLRGDNVDHVAHLSGLIAGLIVAHCIQRLHKHYCPPPRQSRRRLDWSKMIARIQRYLNRS